MLLICLNGKKSTHALDKNWKINHVFHYHYIIYFLCILIISYFLLFVLNYLYPLIPYVQLTKKDLDHIFLLFFYGHEYSRYETQVFNVQPPIVLSTWNFFWNPFKNLCCWYLILDIGCNHNCFYAIVIW